MLKFKKIEKISLNSPVPVYDLTVDGDTHNFAIVNKKNNLIFVHNCDEMNEKGTVKESGHRL